MTQRPNLPPFRDALALLKAHRHYERLGEQTTLEARVAARDEAYPAFVHRALPMLAAGQLDQTLALLVERKELKAKELERLRGTLQGLVAARNVRAADGTPATAFLLAVPLAGVHVQPPADPIVLADAIAQDLTALFQSQAAEDAPAIRVHPLAHPVHALAFSTLSLNQRYALLGDLLPGERERPRLDKLLRAHAALVHPTAPPPKPVPGRLLSVNAPVAPPSPVAGGDRNVLWPVLAIVPHAQSTATPVEMVLDLASLDERSWAATRAQLAGGATAVGPVQAFDVAVLHGLFLHLRATANARLAAQGVPPGTLHLDNLRPSPGGQGLQVFLAQDDQVLPAQFLPFAWLGLVGEVQQAIALLIQQFHIENPEEDGLPAAPVVG